MRAVWVRGCRWVRVVAVTAVVGLSAGIACAKTETVPPAVTRTTPAPTPSATLSPDMQRQFEEDRARQGATSVPAARATTTPPVLDEDGNPQRSIVGDPFGVGRLPPRERDSSCDVLAGFASVVNVGEEENADTRAAARVRARLDDKEYLALVLSSAPTEVRPSVQAWIDALYRWAEAPAEAARSLGRGQAMSVVGEWYRAHC